MQRLCVWRLLGFFALPATARAALLRAGGPREASLVDAKRHRAASSAHVYSWDYGSEGASWKEGECTNTEGQSPINISTTVAAKTLDDDYFFFKYPVYEAPVKMVNDGRFLYALLPNDDGSIGGMAFGKSYPEQLTVAYNLYKLVIHTPSEHTFRGKQVPLEVQLYHRKRDAPFQGPDPAASDTAIVAVGFDDSRDEASPFLRSLIHGGLPEKRGETTLVNRAYPSALRFSELFKPVFGAAGEMAGFWDYNGSITQPPCTSGVRWLVKDEPLNAKKKTLQYFREVVEKSADGIPGNARMVQNVGARPVFPRFARNAVHMYVFNPDKPAAYEDAMARALEHQKGFQEALKTDAGGARAALKSGLSSSETVLQSNEYKECLKALGEVVDNLNTAKLRQTNECNNRKGAEKTLNSVAGGPARLEAAAKHAGFKKSCEDESKVVETLEGQHSTQQDQCASIKSKVKKKVDKAIDKAAAKKVGAGA